ncbi:DMT family transporter [Gilvimarinus agarilyticus]|uniref:DMT family transporter n=1 Tax=Gilvimarinus agarilyticus TaxID=679259 RepID=UPI0012FCF10E|nr:multidrug efflux SMR transporter [Gilvimarinus agarilyticus]
MMVWVLLVTAIVCEVIATSALKSAEGFSRLWPSVIVVLGYGVAFYCLSEVVKTLPLGVTYAIWSGVGVALIAVVGWLVFDQKLDAAALLGLGLIVTGVVIINVFSKTVSH